MRITKENLEEQDFIDFVDQLYEFCGLNIRVDNGILKVYAPTNVVVAEIQAYRDGEGKWQFGGITPAFPDHWTKLCRLREDKSGKVQ